MPNNTCSELNIRFSIFRFLSLVTDTYSLPLFVNDPPTQDDENAMSEEDKYCFVRLTMDDGPQDPTCLLRHLVTFHLYSRHQVREPLTEHNDPALLWLRTMTRQLRHDIQHLTTGPNLVAIYDYESLCNPTNMHNFLTTGDYTKIQNALTGNPNMIPGTGFYVTLGAEPQEFRQEDPRRMVWTMAFRHYAPDNMIWGPRG